MYRKPKGSGSQSILNLDSLMDILSCLVGVMLFLVIYTVLELGSAAYEVSVPTARDQPFDSRRVLVVANGGTVRVLDPSRPTRDLLTGLDAIDLDEIPARVRETNVSPPTDEHFRYGLVFNEEAAVLDGRTREFLIEIDELPDEPGETPEQLDEASVYFAALDDLDPQLVWLEFAVDSVSIEVFRRARDHAEEHGFATRWEPLALEFPVTYVLTDSADGPEPRRIESKPRR